MNAPRPPRDGDDDEDDDGNAHKTALPGPWTCVGGVRDRLGLQSSCISRSFEQGRRGLC